MKLYRKKKNIYNSPKKFSAEKEIKTKFIKKTLTEKNFIKKILSTKFLSFFFK